MEASFTIYAIKLPGPDPVLRHVCKIRESVAIECYLFELKKQGVKLPNDAQFDVALYELGNENYFGYVRDISAPDAEWSIYRVSNAGVCLGYIGRVRNEYIPNSETQVMANSPSRIRSPFEGPSFE